MPKKTQRIMELSILLSKSTPLIQNFVCLREGGDMGVHVQSWPEYEVSQFYEENVTIKIN